MNNLVKELTERGLVEHTSAPLETILAKKRAVYLGVDPSADSMQAGNLALVLLLKRLSDAGHKVILLVGGGTGMIGDPKEKGERPLASAKVVAANKKKMRAQMEQIIGKSVPVVDNASWLLKLRLVDFLRDIGKHFTVNELIKRDTIKRRLETPDESISYTEFAYALLQGYDFLHLNRTKGVDVQIGGSDQWTNILSGVELIRRKDGREAFALTCPLVTDAQGKKFGKSEGNAVWLSAKKTSPYDFYQFWVTQPDAVVEKYLKMYTFLSLEEIGRLVEAHMKDPGKRLAQKKLAAEVTELVHGRAEATKAVNASNARFTSEKDITELKKYVKNLEIKLGEQQKMIELLVEMKQVSSKNQARQAIEANGVTFGGVKITDIHTTTAAYPAGDYELKFGRHSSVISIVEK